MVRILLSQPGAFRCDKYNCVMKKNVCVHRNGKDRCLDCSVNKTYLRIDWAFQLWGMDIVSEGQSEKYKSAIKRYQQE